MRKAFALLAWVLHGMFAAVAYIWTPRWEHGDWTSIVTLFALVAVWVFVGWHIAEVPDAQ